MTSTLALATIDPGGPRILSYDTTLSAFSSSNKSPPSSRFFPATSILDSLIKRPTCRGPTVSPMDQSPPRRSCTNAVCVSLQLRRSTLLTTPPVNPWARRDDHSQSTILGYKVATLLTWLVLFVNGAVYTFTAPGEGTLKRRTVWGQNSAHPTPFSLNEVITSIYW
jgi:hypothetical protein